MMRHLIKIFLWLAPVVFIGCKKDHDPSPLETNIAMLTAVSWGKPTVTHTDGDLSADYAGFVMVFTQNKVVGYEGTYVVSNGGYAFPVNSGKWRFDKSLKKIQTDAGQEYAYTLSERQLQLDFYVSSSGGRTKGVNGHFIFSLKPL